MLIFMEKLTFSEAYWGTYKLTRYGRPVEKSGFFGGIHPRWNLPILAGGTVCIALTLLGCLFFLSEWLLIPLGVSFLAACGTYGFGRFRRCRVDLVFSFRWSYLLCSLAAFVTLLTTSPPSFAPGAREVILGILSILFALAEALLLSVAFTAAAMAGAIFVVSFLNLFVALARLYGDRRHPEATRKKPKKH